MTTPTQTLTASRTDMIIAGYAALGVAIFVVEAAFPSPLPGVKPGLANVITLIALFRHGLKVAIWVTLLRVLVGSLLIGTFLTPTFMMSFAGALCAIAAMSLLAPLRHQILGPLGISVLAALAHMSGQILVAYYWLIGHEAVLGLLPPLLTAAVIFGCLSGLIAAATLTALTKHSPPPS